MPGQDGSNYMSKMGKTNYLTVFVYTIYRIYILDFILYSILSFRVPDLK